MPGGTPCSTFSPLLPDDCCVLLMTGVCFLSAEIFGEQFLRVGRAVINGCTNFSERSPDGSLATVASGESSGGGG